MLDISFFFLLPKWKLVTRKLALGRNIRVSSSIFVGEKEENLVTRAYHCLHQNGDSIPFQFLDFQTWVTCNETARHTCILYYIQYSSTKNILLHAKFDVVCNRRAHFKTASNYIKSFNKTYKIQWQKRSSGKVSLSFSSSIKKKNRQTEDGSESWCTQN